MYLAGMLITVWLGILSTRANVSFARMRRKYIEDNEEQDKKLIAKRGFIIIPTWFWQLLS